MKIRLYLVLAAMLFGAQLPAQETKNDKQICEALQTVEGVNTMITTTGKVIMYLFPGYRLCNNENRKCLFFKQPIIYFSNNSNNKSNKHSFIKNNSQWLTYFLLLEQCLSILGSN